MWVYGDRSRRADPRAEIASLRLRLQALEAPAGQPPEPPIAYHGRLVNLFVEAAALGAALADAALEQAGEDARTPVTEASTALLLLLAAALLASWDVLGDALGEARPAPRLQGAGEALDALAALELPEAVTLKRAEGYGFYALYPEGHGEAARRLGLGRDAQLIGVRSIGLGLAAVAAAALGAEAPASVRPVGHPFRRTLAVAPALAAEWETARDRAFVAVDEGPGLSGSSLGAVADALEALGARDIAFLPGHGGELGPQASAPHRARWAAARRPVVEFDALALNTSQPGHRLQHWFKDLAGGEGMLQDLSGGAWRARLGAESAWPAVDSHAERRKFRLHGPSGQWLLKFQGLGNGGEAAFQLQQSLGLQGFSPHAGALRHGFSATEWVDDAAPMLTGARLDCAVIDRIGDYLGWRAAHLPMPDDAGAPLDDLWEMMRTNLKEGLGEEGAGAAPVQRLLDPALWRDAPPLRRVWTDNRLHAHEWLRGPDGRWLKTDAVEHACGHDLIGAQDIAWDLAGAGVELDLVPPQAERLLAAVRVQAPVEPALVALLRPAYLAFQLGLWTMAAAAHAGWPQEQARLARQAARYRRRLRDLAT